MDLLHCKRVIDSWHKGKEEEEKTVEEEEEDKDKALLPEEEEEERNFEPGRHDVSDIFFITPNKLYGRETDLQMLLETYKRACSSRTSQVILVTGYAGKIYIYIAYIERERESREWRGNRIDTRSPSLVFFKGPSLLLVIRSLNLPLN